MYFKPLVLNKLLDHNITSIGTVIKGKIGRIGKELFDIKYRGNFSTTCHFEMEKKDSCLTTYSVVTK